MQVPQTVRRLAGDLKQQLTWYRRAQWSLLGVAAVAAGALYALAIHPAGAELDGLHRRTSADAAELSTDRDQARALPMVEQEIARLRYRVDRFDKKLPKQQDLAAFIADVTRISEASSLRNLAWRPDARPRRTEQFAELPIQFSFAGDFQTGVCPFLRRAEDMSRLTRVRRLKVTSSPSRDGQVDVELTMNIYFGEE